MDVGEQYLGVYDPENLRISMMLKTFPFSDHSCGEDLEDQYRQEYIPLP